MLAAFVLIGTASAQTISADQTALAFSAQAGSGPVTQTVNITSSSGTVGVSISATQQVATTPPWLSVNTVAGATPLALVVTADPSKLNNGQYLGTVTVGAVVNGSGQTIG